MLTNLETNCQHTHTHICQIINVPTSPSNDWLPSCLDPAVQIVQKFMTCYILPINTILFDIHSYSWYLWHSSQIHTSKHLIFIYLLRSSQTWLLKRKRLGEKISTYAMIVDLSPWSVDSSRGERSPVFTEFGSDSTSCSVVVTAGTITWIELSMSSI